VHSLEEQRYKKVAWLKKQPRQMALLVRPDFSLIPFRVARVEAPEVTDRMFENLVSRRFRETPFVIEESAMLTQFEVRTRELHERAGIPEADLNLMGDQFDPFDNG
jgi:hypothetical protein